MTPAELAALAPGDRITYNDGRPGHTAARAVVLEAATDFITVQFKDRADTTVISCHNPAWTNHLTKETPDMMTNKERIEATIKQQTTGDDVQAIVISFLTAIGRLDLADTSFDEAAAYIRESNPEAADIMDAAADRWTELEGN